MKKATCPKEQSRPCVGFKCSTPLDITKNQPKLFSDQCDQTVQEKTWCDQLSRKQVFINALAALQRLTKVAAKDTGQSKTVGLFLLSLYNGYAYPLNPVHLRSLDANLHADCLAVLQLDYQPVKEIHEYLPNGSQLFKQLSNRLIQEA